MCEKNLKVLQLNLRGQNKMPKGSKIKYTVPLTEAKINHVNKESSHRPKSLVEDRSNRKITRLWYLGNLLEIPVWLSNGFVA
jgi:hypothetical protein